MGVSQEELNAGTVIQISSARVKSDPEGISRLRAQFREFSCICIPQLLDPTLVATLQHRLEHCQWKPNAHNDPGGELGLDDITEDPRALHLLYFSANRPEFRKLLEEVTGCQPLNAFGGRLYRKRSGRRTLQQVARRRCRQSPGGNEYKPQRPALSRRTSSIAQARFRGNSGSGEYRVRSCSNFQDF